jgi:hypothetical protein
MKAGRYLRKRREAAGLTIADVAARLVPLELDRRLWRTEEANCVGMSRRDISLLRGVFPFDPAILRRLIEGDESDQICRRCGCSEQDACSDQHPGAGIFFVEPVGCHWVAHDLCSACAAVGGSRPTPHHLHLNPERRQ